MIKKFDDLTVVEFGRGTVTVEPGKYGSQHAVFINNADVPGTPGQPAPKTKTPHGFEPDEIVLVFPSKKRAAEVANSLFDGELVKVEGVQQPAPDVEGLEMVVAAQDGQYPPCDFCGVIPDHHPWHGSGMFKGVDSPHIHACNGCRHLLPSHAASDATQLAEALEAVMEFGCDPKSNRGWWALDKAESALAAYRKQVPVVTTPDEEDTPEPELTVQAFIRDWNITGQIEKQLIRKAWDQAIKSVKK